MHLLRALTFTLILFASLANATDIFTKWDQPTVVFDGYYLKHTLDGDTVETITLAYDQVNYTFVDVQEGVHWFYITGFLGEIESEPPSETGLFLLNSLKITVEAR